MIKTLFFLLALDVTTFKMVPLKRECNMQDILDSTRKTLPLYRIQYQKLPFQISFFRFVSMALKAKLIEIWRKIALLQLLKKTIIMKSG
jgi:hypothetical protein